MTLRLSPTQLSIIDYLKGNPNNTPEMWAKATGHKAKTAYTQLGRARAKDKEARVFRAFYNGMIGRYPWLRQYLKPQMDLTPKEKEDVDRGLQNPKQTPTEGRGSRKGVRKQGPDRGPRRHGATRRKAPNHRTRKSVRK